MDTAVQEAVKEISTNHRKIIDDWCKAYLAELYGSGFDIKPGCFTLNQMEVKEGNIIGWKYWFTIEKNPMNTDEVNHPSHYQGHTFEVIDIIEDYDLNFNVGNALKYILRAGKKGDRNTDLNKAIWYLQREADRKDGV